METSRSLSEILPVEQHGDEPALFFGDDVVTFAQLKQRVTATARLMSRVSQVGDRISIVGPNAPAWIDCYYGVPDSGRLLVFLNDRLAVGELASIVRRSDSRVLIGPEQQLNGLRSELGDSVTTIEEAEWEKHLEGCEPQVESARSLTNSGQSGAAWIIYTSGTTGVPKGAVLTTENILAALAGARACRPVRADDVFLFPFPLCHVAGYNVLHLHAHGRPVVIMRRFESSAFIDAIDRYGVTSASLTATMLSGVLEVISRHPDRRRQLSTLRTLQYGAAPMPTSLVRRAHAELGVELNQGYGMTELAGNAVFLDAEAHRHALDGDERVLRSAGRPAPNVEVAIMSDDGRMLGPEEAGEIVVKGSQVMVGYWDDPEATRSALRHSWLHTGDVGTMDETGLLFVVDRKKDLVVSGGENIASREVEDEILRVAPEVLEVAVVGIPDPHWGENVCAVVTFSGTAPQGQLDIDALNHRLEPRLARFKLPRHLVSTPELPKNATGKIDKKAIRSWLLQERDLIGDRWTSPGARETPQNKGSGVNGPDALSLDDVP